MNTGLPWHTRVRIRIRQKKKPYSNAVTAILETLQRCGLYSWHCYRARKEQHRSRSGLWFPEYETRGM
jgi:hypothetical protein